MTTINRAQHTNVHYKQDRSNPSQLLTMRSLLLKWPTFKRSLDQIPFNVTVAETPNDLLVVLERNDIDIVLVDIDDIEESQKDLYAISNHRLVELLIRQLTGRPIALVVFTIQDFVEIEDLARSGIHALIHQGLNITMVVEYLQAALERIRRRLIASQSAS